MKVNKNSNTYNIVYATVMVVVVALVLAFASLSLQPLQKANAENEMKGAILQSIGLEGDMAQVKDKTAYINERYDKYIKESFVVDTKGGTVGDADAFSLVSNLKAVYDKPAEERQLPVFVSVNDEGATRYVLPLRGTGLWGPLWGYLALESDWETIYGAVFDHASETPGLGAEIATPPFHNQFKGKSIFRGGKLQGIAVTKGAGSSAGNPGAVDAISGGTITSRGVEDMINDNLAGYAAFIEKQRAVPAEAGESAPKDEPLTTENHE